MLSPFNKVFYRFLLLLCLWSSATLSAQTNPECIKKVFSLFCLGETIQTPSDQFIQQENTSTYLFRNSKIFITLEQGKITRISRHIPPGDWLNYFNWTDKLTTKYGPGEDLSQFPPSSSSRSSRLKAIIFHKGFARQIWQQKDWSVEVLWDSPDYIQMIYKLKQHQQPSFNLDDL